MAAQPRESHGTDVFGGCAGAATGLVALAKLIDEPWILETATELGEVLISRANSSPEGWSWPDADEAANHDLCGFSYGTAGIGHALFELFGATRDTRFREAGERAFDYEQWWFERRSGTWPDLRGVARAAGWDAPLAGRGLVVSRRAGHRAIAAAGRATRVARGEAPRRGRRARDHPGARLAPHIARPRRLLAVPRGRGCRRRAPLCSGVPRRGRPQDLFRLAADIGLLGIERYYLTGAGFPCGLPEGQTPGLFLGLAGIGLFYLRLADQGVATPLIVHSRAALDEPRTARPRVGVRPGKRGESMNDLVDLEPDDIVEDLQSRAGETPDLLCAGGVSRRSPWGGRRGAGPALRGSLRCIVRVEIERSAIRKRERISTERGALAPATTRYTVGAGQPLRGGVRGSAGAAAAGVPERPGGAVDRTAEEHAGG